MNKTAKIIKKQHFLVNPCILTRFLQNGLYLAIGLAFFICPGMNKGFAFSEKDVAGGTIIYKSGPKKFRRKFKRKKRGSKICFYTSG